MAVNFEVRKTDNRGVVFQGEIDGTQQVIIDVIVETGVVGNTYNGFVNRDKITVNYPASYNQGQIDAQIAAEASAFVTATYPNIV